MLFGDLVKGTLYATVSSGLDVLNTVFKMGVTDGVGGTNTLADFLGVARADLRFFNVADGGAGVLLERTGQAYRISEVIPAVPLPPGGVLLGFGLMAGTLIRRRRTTKR